MKANSMFLILGLVGLVQLIHAEPDRPDAGGFVDRKELKKELETLDTSLKSLRQKAYREEEVIAARKAVDEAFRVYYRVLRETMAKLEPERAEDIKRVVKLREQLYGKHGGSRAEDYETAKPKSRK